MRSIVNAATLFGVLAVFGGCSRDLPSQPSPQFVTIFGAGDSTLTARVTSKPAQIFPSTDITFAVPDSRRVVLTVNNITGYHIATIFDGTTDAGSVLVSWEMKNEDGKPLKAGLYYYHLAAGDLDQKLFFGLCTTAEECEKLYDPL